MSLLSIEKTSEECFILVRVVNCFGVIVRGNAVESSINTFINTFSKLTQ